VRARAGAGNRQIALDVRDREDGRVAMGNVLRELDVSSRHELAAVFGEG
jgi:hypothetical protein